MAYYPGGGGGEKKLHMAAVKNYNKQYKSPRKMISMAVL
jgi:hypothetical protein